MTDLTVNQLLEVDPKFVLEVASGIRDPADIAQDYGYTGTQWLVLKEFGPFVKAVEAKRAELTATGYTFRMKAAVGAEELLAEVFTKAVSDDVSFHTQLEALKFMARAAGLDAPPREEAAAGEKFSITINLGGGNVVEIGGGKVESKIVNDDLPYYAPHTTEDFEIPYDSSALFEDRNTWA